jgi:hypothetical protein
LILKWKARITVEAGRTNARNAALAGMLAAAIILVVVIVIVVMGRSGHVASKQSFIAGDIDGMRANLDDQVAKILALVAVERAVLVKLGAAMRAAYFSNSSTPRDAATQAANNAAHMAASRAYFAARESANSAKT